MPKALQEQWRGSGINRKGSEAVNTRFSFQETQLKDALLITPFCAEDRRGAFIKDYSREVFQANGLHHDLAEVFYAASQKGVVRGMHFQREHQQAKLVRCIHGCVYDVIVDLRPESETFLKWQGFWLTGENLQMLYVPEHFAHGYMVTEDAIVSYKCNERFYGEYDDGIHYLDPDIGISWPFELIGGVEHVILSQKDEGLQSFQDYQRKYL